MLEHQRQIYKAFKLALTAILTILDSFLIISKTALAKYVIQPSETIFDRVELKIFEKN